LKITDLNSGLSISVLEEKSYVKNNCWS